MNRSSNGPNIFWVVMPLILVLVSGCGADPRSADAVQQAWQDRILQPLNHAGLTATVTSQAADMVCDGKGQPSTSGWVLRGTVTVSGSVDAVTAALRPHLAVVEPGGNRTVRVQQRRQDPIGWTGQVHSGGQNVSQLDVSSNVRVEAGRPDPAWRRGCS